MRQYAKISGADPLLFCLRALRLWNYVIADPYAGIPVYYDTIPWLNCYFIYEGKTADTLYIPPRFDKISLV